MNETSHSATAGDVHANGSRPALSDRVRSLRLSDAPDETTSRRVVLGAVDAVRDPRGLRGLSLRSMR